MKIKKIYKVNKEKKVGEECTCPSCNTVFVKTNYQQAFCKSKEGTICKDRYWNTITPNKRNNKTRISPASAAFMSSRSRFTAEEYKIIQGVAYDECGEKVYDVGIGNWDVDDSEYWNDKDF